MIRARACIASTSAAAAAACLAAAAVFASIAVWTHLTISALGPICGLSRSGQFFLHCPACPAALLCAFAGMALAGRALADARRRF